MANPLKNLNYISNHFKHPCHINVDGQTEVKIIISSAFAAAVPVLMASKTFSCMDILKTRAGISWQCGRALKAAIEQAHKPGVVNAGHFAYSITGAALLERALWYYFIAELATEFAANWTSLMYSQNGCAGPYSGTLVASAGPFDYEAGTENGRVLFGGGGGNDCAAVGGQNIVVQAGCNADVSFTNTVEKCGNGQPLCSLQTSIIETSSGIVFNSSNFSDGQSADNNGNITLAQKLDGGIGGRSYQVKVQSTGADGTCAQLNKGRLTVTTSGHSVRPTPIGCTPRSVSL